MAVGGVRRSQIQNPRGMTQNLGPLMSTITDEAIGKPDPSANSLC